MIYYFNLLQMQIKYDFEMENINFLMIIQFLYLFIIKIIKLKWNFKKKFFLVIIL